MPGGSLTCRWTPSLKFGYSSWGPESDWQMMLADTSSAWKWPFSLSHSPAAKREMPRVLRPFFQPRHSYHPQSPPPRALPREGRATDPKSRPKGKRKVWVKERKGRNRICEHATRGFVRAHPGIHDQLSDFGGHSGATAFDFPFPPSEFVYFSAVVFCSGHIL